MDSKFLKINNDIKVTIYIPCFGYEKFINDSIKSLRNQTFKAFKCYVFILKEDLKAKEIILKAIGNDNRFLINELEKRPTIQFLGNLVLNKSTSEYLLRLDADDKLDLFALQILINAADEDKMIAMVWGCFYYCSEDGDLHNISPYKTILSDRKDPPHGACTLIRTSALRAISGYDEDIKSQDGFDIWQRLKSIYKVKALPQVIFYYTQHQNSLSKSNKRMNLSSSMIHERKEKAFSGSLKKQFMIVVGIRDMYDSSFKNSFVQELKENNNGDNKIQEIIKLSKSLSTETKLVISTTSKEVLDYCDNLKENKDSFIASFRSDETNKGVPIINILRHGLNEFMKFNENLPSMLIFINTHTNLPTKAELNDSWLKLTCSSNSMYMPVEAIREIVLNKNSENLEILNPGRFKDIYPAHEKLWKWKENFLCCTPDSILQDFMLSSITSDFKN